MKKFKYLLFTFFICIGSSSRAQWQQINVSTGFYKIQFINDSVGFGLNQKSIMKTINYGLSWDTIFIAAEKKQYLNDLFFFNGNLGYVSGQDTSDFLIKTFDGGKYWKRTNIKTSAWKIFFTSPATGFALASHTLLASKDSGVTWPINCSVAASGSIGNIFFLNQNIGYSANWYPGNISKTIDAGKTWSQQLTSNQKTSLAPQDIFATSKDTAYSIDLLGIILRTSDGGLTWNPCFSPTPKTSSLYSIYCPDNNTCYAVGDSGVIIKTTDGGDSWSIQKPGVHTRLTSVFCIDANTCYASGNGVFLRTLNGGTGINKSYEKKSEVRVYPNPMTNMGIVTINNSTLNNTGMNKCEFILYDLLGHKVFQKIIINNTESFFRGNLQDGVFFYKIIDDTNLIKSGKLIIQ